MTDLKAQKRMAADVLDVGKSRVWFDPERQADIADAITREDVRELVEEGAIRRKTRKVTRVARRTVSEASDDHRREPVPGKGRQAHGRLEERLRVTHPRTAYEAARTA
ncbi:hypothetical protein C9J85_08210 [Haloferax sp. wsp5]|nr:hypothetical protein C9J85_08210 [Haloferax sp. wsp5]